ncbi:hypothetical protein Tco_0876715 [Tanacetum coccineum]|uniref:Uncharacterized protein n=1 Tax=Tanacetum coccineum TaxID=301880 RepID=A0ABQ5BYU8_9ASTR
MPRTDLIDLSSKESSPIQNHPINTTLDTTLTLYIPPSTLGQTNPTKGNIVSPLAHRALLFSTPPNSSIEPHPYLASLDDLPPRSSNPQPQSHSQDGRFSPVALVSSIEVMEPPRTRLQYWPVLLLCTGCALENFLIGEVLPSLAYEIKHQGKLVARITHLLKIYLLISKHHQSSWIIESCRKMSTTIFLELDGMSSKWNIMVKVISIWNQ